MAIKNTVAIFDPRTFIVKSVFDCSLSGVLTLGEEMLDLVSSHTGASTFLCFYTRFFFRKKGILISYQSQSMVGPSVRLSVTFHVNVSPPKPLELATSNFVAE